MKVLATDIAIIIILLAIFTIPLSLIVRTIASVFSKKVRSQIIKHPYLHLLWLGCALIVIVILLNSASSRPGGPSNTMKARYTLDMLKTSVGMFKGDLERYPSSGNANLVKCLTTNKNCKIGNPPSNFTAKEIKDWSGPYMRFEYPDKIDNQGELLDPWGRPYIYTSDGSSYSIYSCGPDRIAGTQDDIIVKDNEN